jgi:hypothetical protein
MQNVINKRLAFLGLIWVGVACGCESGMEALAPVRGKVTYQGRALSTGVIVFTPDPERGSSGPVARAEIQPDGSYALSTRDLPGAASGWHRVTLVALELPSGEVPRGPFTMPRSLLPERYRDPQLSGLVRKVKAGEENRIDFDLE